ncbi:hypothetical protein [Exiguobacterium sp. SL-9]|uniref:hypothetical protein n=1 Tax=Exiguobacterium sp. SL-9 TaxID=2510963 RepID=UPI001039C441|nr:hypothetical protein [Exiguobacterium sp. SL-9]TCI20325.1 hypothetical protein EVJ34_14755 [Exiguobacterium sp. SL-9]
MDKQVETICRLNGIACRFGGSTLLKQHGLIETANDLDVFVEPDQFERLDQVLSRAGRKVESAPHLDYVTTYFGEYEFEGGDIDVMASFRMKCTDGIYTHPYIEPTGSWMHLEEWIVLYTVMNRIDKLERLSQYFETHPMNETIVQTCLKRAPASVIESVTERFGARMKR